MFDDDEVLSKDGFSEDRLTKEALEPFEYNVDPDGSVRITGIKDSTAEEALIPYGVTKIKSGAFSELKMLKRVFLPEGITMIGEEVFARCKALTEIHIPEGVKSIGWCAFYYCTSLTKVYLPKSLKLVDEAAFGMCTALKEVYYRGSGSDFRKIILGRDNRDLTLAKRHLKWEEKK